MADTPRTSGTGDDTGVEPDRATTTGTSRWQIVVGIIGLLVVLFVGTQMVGNLLGRGPGPGGHGPGGGLPPPGSTEEFDPADLEDLSPDEIEEYFEDLHG